MMLGIIIMQCTKSELLMIKIKSHHLMSQMLSIWQNAYMLPPKKSKLCRYFQPCDGGRKKVSYFQQKKGCSKQKKERVFANKKKLQ